MYIILCYWLVGQSSSMYNPFNQISANEACMRFKGNRNWAILYRIILILVQIFCWGWTLKWTLKLVPKILYTIFVFSWYFSTFLATFFYQKQRSSLIGCCLGHWAQDLNIVINKRNIYIIFWFFPCLLVILSYLEVHPRPWQCYPTLPLTMNPIPLISLIFLLFYDCF